MHQVSLSVVYCVPPDEILCGISKVPVLKASEDVYQWNGRSETGAELPDGIYSARLSFDNSITGVMLLKLE